MARKQWQISAEARRKRAKEERAKRSRARARDEARQARKDTERNAKVDRLVQRGRADLERERNKAIEEFQRFDKRLATDPITALNLRFDPVANAIVQDTVEVRGTTIDLVRGRQNRLETQPEVSGDTWRVRLVDALVGSWGTVLAVEVQNTADTFAITLRWVKKTKPEESACFLVDAQHGQYVYPVSTSLKGKVVPGVPRTELVVFRPFTHPTDRVTLQVQDVKLTAKGPRVSFELPVPIHRLPDHIKAAQGQPNVSTTLLKRFDADVAAGLAEIEKQAARIKRGKKSGCGCGCAPMVLATIATAGMLASQFEGFPHPVAFMTSLLFTLDEAFGALLPMDQSRSIVGVLGLIMLMGLVRKRGYLADRRVGSEPHRHTRQHG